MQKIINHSFRRLTTVNRFGSGSNHPKVDPKAEVKETPYNPEKDIDLRGY